MAIVREDLAKALLSAGGIKTPAGTRVDTIGDVLAASEDIGDYPIYVKALIPRGRKNRVDAVKKVESREELVRTARSLLSRTFEGVPPDGLLLEESIIGGMEIFVGVTLSSLDRGFVLLMSQHGGIDVEAVLDDEPNAMRSLSLDPQRRLDIDAAKNAASELGFPAALAQKLAALSASLWDIVRNFDLVTLEINPVIPTDDGDLVAVGALADVDDDALFRHPDITPPNFIDSGRYGGRLPTDLERYVTQLSASDPTGSAMLVEIPDGHLAWLFAGGGCSLYSADLCEALGGRPRTYFDSTTLTPATLEEIVWAVLGLPGLEGLGIGSNVRSMVQVDEEMVAIAAAVRRRRIDTTAFPIVVRLAGPGEERAKVVAARTGITHFGRNDTIDEAVAALVAAARSSEAQSHEHPLPPEGRN